MPKVRYVGASHFREIDAASWKSVDVNDQTKVVWDRDKDDAHKVSEAAWNYLQRGEKGDFELVESADPIAPPPDPQEEPIP